MKTSLIIKSLALILAAGYPVVAFAEFVGARVPASVNFENSFAIFASAVIGLTLIGDYARRNRFNLAVASAAAPVRAAKSARENHRLAA